MLEKQQEKLKEINIKFMEKAIDLVLEGKLYKVELTGVSIIELLNYFNSKVPKVHQIDLEDLEWTNQPSATKFEYGASLYGKYSILGDFYNNWIEFSLNSTYDYYY
jgi:nucleosome binding factor SPN SPT16 subunit